MSNTFFWDRHCSHDPASAVGKVSTGMRQEPACGPGLDTCLPAPPKPTSRAASDH